MITLIEFIILYYVAQTHELLNILWVFALSALVIIFAASMFGVALSGIFRGRTIGVAAPLAVSLLIFVAACSIPSVVGLNEPITGPTPTDGPPVYNVTLSAAPDITRLVPGDSIYINAAGNRWWVVPNCTACERIAPPTRAGFRHLQTVGETVRRRDAHQSGHYNIEGREH